MTKLARRGVLVTLAGVGLLLMATMLLVESPWAREWLAGRVSQRLNGRHVEIGGLDIDWGWPLTVHLEDVTVDNPGWAPHERMLDLGALEVAVSPDTLLMGRFELARLSLSQPVIHLARREDGTSNWGVLAGQKNLSSRGRGLGISPAAVTVDEGRLTFHDPSLAADLKVEFQTRDGEDGARELSVEAQGRVQGVPLELRGHGGIPSRSLAGDGEAYPLMLQGHLGQLEARFDGRLRDVSQSASLQGKLDMSASQAASVAKMLGHPAWNLPSLELHGRLSHQDRQWSLQDATARLGETRVRGALSIVAGGERPEIHAQLHADQLDLSRRGLFEAGDPMSQADPQAPSAQAVPWERRLARQLAPLQGVDAQVDLSINQLSYGDTWLGNVDLKGRLEAGRLEVHNLHAAQNRGALTAQGWLNIQPQTLSGDIDAHLSQLDLGEALAPLGSGHLGTLDGRLHARLLEGELTLDDTSLDYRLSSQGLLLHVKARAAHLTGASAPSVQLQGDGSRHGEAFEYDLQVGPLLNLRNPGKPYPVQGRITSGGSTLHVDGTLEKPLELGLIRTPFRLSGPNPAHLNTLTGLNLPALPPYELEGELRVRDNLIRLLDLDGTFGDSKVSGDVRWRLGERSMLWATLHSQRLDLDDLAPLTGRAPETGRGETVSPAQQVRAHEEGRQPRVFSDREWNLPDLRKMDAHVRYGAERVNAENVPLSSVSLELTLEDGVLTLDPLRMGLGGGTVVAQLRLDAHGQALDGSLDLSARRVNLKPVLRRAGVPEIAEDSAGTLGGQGRVRFTGGSMDELMANLDGRLELGMSGGRLDMLLMETVGLDVLEALLVELADADKVPMRCAYVRLEADSGVASIEQFFISTADSNITGGGQVDLDGERLNLVFEAHPKDPSLLASDSPVRVQGDLTSPQVDVVSRELIARGVLSVLAALVAPPLAILPWVEPGLGEGAGPGCRQVLDESRGTRPAAGG